MKADSALPETLAEPALQRIGSGGPAAWEGTLPRKPFSLDEARAYCERLARTHYENFPVATFLLPRRLRPHFYSVYAYCRWADDLGDETNDPARSLWQ